MILSLDRFGLVWMVNYMTKKYVHHYPVANKFWSAFDPTGRSKATVTNNISLMNLKIAKNGLTQSFLASLYAAVLVF